jgi:adenylate cyclase
MTVADATAPAKPRAWEIDASVLRQARVASGSVLFVYVTLHLINHALALIALDVADDALLALRALWRSLPGTMLLYGALLVHLSLALWAIYQRRRLRMSGGEWARMILGLAIIPLIALHVTGTRLAHALFDVDTGYVYVLVATWIESPWVNGLRQTIGLLAAWIHGCIGLHLIWRLKPWYSRVVPLLYAAAVLLPTLALLGYVSAGREAEQRLADAEWRQQFVADNRLPSRDQLGSIYAIGAGILLGFAGLVAATFGARTVRTMVLRRHGCVRVSYPDRRAVDVQPGT